jgi:argonaute-like protein implicated in RNA metabolism and viral defense
MNKMQKIPCQEAFNHEAFEIANTFIKQKIEQIASHIPKTNEDEMEKRILNHYNMVAQITRMYLFIIESFTASDLKDLNKQKGNIVNLNRLLALRQLCEKQLHSIMNGGWGLKKEVVESDNFKRKVAIAKLHFSKEDIYNSVA